MESYRRGQRIKEWREKDHHEDEDEVEAEVSFSFSCRAVRNTRLSSGSKIVSRAHGNIKSQPPKPGEGGTQGLTRIHHQRGQFWSDLAPPSGHFLFGLCKLHYPSKTCNAGFLSHGNKLHGAHFGT